MDDLESWKTTQCKAGDAEIRHAGSTIKPCNIKCFDYIPLLLKHVSNLNESSFKDNFVVSIFNGRVHFKHCLVYGTVLEKIGQNNTCSYLLDDGTGCLQMKIMPRYKSHKEVSKLERDVRDLTGVSNEKIIGSLKNILLATKSQMNNNLVRGSKALIYGRPSYFRNQVSITAFHVLQDSNMDQNIEIIFKDELINWYKTNLLSNKN